MLCSIFLVKKWARITYTRVQNVWYGWPAYEVRCLCSKGQEWGRVTTPTNISTFDSYDMKCLWFKFGHDIFTGYKMASHKVRMPVLQPFNQMKLITSNFKVLVFWSHWRYHDQIQITSSSYHMYHILKCWWEWQPSLPHSHSLEHRHFTSKTEHPSCQTFWTQVYLLED